jgi:hypothetical protein
MLQNLADRDTMGTLEEGLERKRQQALGPESIVTEGEKK